MPCNNDELQFISEQVQTAVSAMPPPPAKLLLARIPPTSEELVRLLPGVLTVFRQQFDTSTATNSEVCAAIIALVYGPENAGPPQLVVLAEVEAAARFDKGPLRMAVERALAFGALLPIPPKGNRPPVAERWSYQWEGSYCGLVRLIWELLQGQFRQLEKMLNHPFDTETRLSDSVLLAQALINGCECWLEAKDRFRVARRIRCCIGHRLAAWEGNSSLDEFLVKVLLNNTTAVRQRVNDFRFGMFPKAIHHSRTGAALVAGMILRCRASDPCGEIEPTNECDRCRHPASVEDPAWWLWFDGDRREICCRRCNHIDLDAARELINAWPDPDRKRLALVYVDKECDTSATGKHLGVLKERQVEFFESLRQIKQELRSAGVICGFLYYPARFRNGTLKLDQPCPSGHSHTAAWSKRDTCVWVRRNGRHADAEYQIDPLPQHQDGPELDDLLVMLVPEERQLAVLLANGLTLTEAAEELRIPIQTRAERAHFRMIVDRMRHGLQPFEELIDNLHHELG